MTTAPAPATLPNLVGFALAYARRGWRVFPLHSPAGNGGCSCGQDCGAVGKHPRLGGTFKIATSDEAQIREWWRRWPNANIGIACGLSGLLVVDVDPRNGGDATWAGLIQDHGYVPCTTQVRTGSGGWHVYYQRPEAGFVSSKNTFGPGIDSKADGGYVVAPPSLHESGDRYQFQPGLDPGETAPGLPPDWLVGMVKSRAVHRARGTPIDGDCWLLTAFDAAGWLGSMLDTGAHVARCPWQHEHTGGREGDSSTVILPRTTEHSEARFHCSHGHCQDRTPADVRAALPPEAVRLADERFPPPPESLADAAVGYAGDMAEDEVPADPDLEEHSCTDGTPAARTKRGFVLQGPDTIWQPLPPLQWLADGILLRGTVCQIMSYGGSGKSWLGVQLAVSVATGRRWLGRFGCAMGKVAYLDWENGSYELRRRLHAVAVAEALDPPLALLEICSMPSVYLSDADIYTHLRVLAEGRAAIVIDTLKAGSPGTDENDSRSRIPLDVMRRVADQTGCCFVVLLHSKKTTGSQHEIDPREQGRGSSALYDAADSVLHIVYKQGEPMLVHQTKSRTGKSAEPFAVTITDTTDGGVLVAAEDVRDEDDSKEQEFEARCERVLDIVRANPMCSTSFVQERSKSRNGKASVALERLERDGAVRNVGLAGERKRAAWVATKAGE